MITVGLKTLATVHLANTFVGIFSVDGQELQKNVSDEVVGEFGAPVGLEVHG